MAAARVNDAEGNRPERDLNGEAAAAITAPVLASTKWGTNVKIPCAVKKILDIHQDGTYGPASFNAFLTGPG